LGTGKALMVCASQSVLSVIGKASSASNVERLDFKIINPQPVLAGRHKSRGANGTSSLEIEDEEAEEVDTGITTKLEIKIVCKHGECPPPPPQECVA
jgi:hypothetical protein